MPVITAVFCVLAGYCSAVVETVGRKPEAGVLKMLAASAYIAFAFQMGAAATVYGTLILAALAFSWLGDLFLIGEGGLFLAGLGSFLLAHTGYAAAFVVRGAAPIPTAVGALVMVAVAVSFMRWLDRAGDVPRAQRIPIVVYVGAIGVMVALALGTAWPDLITGGEWAVAGRSLLLGAGAFAISDILLARHRFVKAEAWNRLVGLPLYLAAQLLLASSV